MIMLLMVMWILTVLTAEDLDTHVSFVSVYTLMGIFGKTGSSQTSTIIFDPWFSIFDPYSELANVKALAHLATSLLMVPLLDAFCNLHSGGIGSVCVP